MPGKVLLIAALITFAIWFGSIAGCASQQRQENNYKILNEDKPRFDHSTDPNKPGESMVPTTQPVAVAPSLKGVDRSRWDHITVTPATDATWHSPVYFHDCPIGHDRRGNYEPDPVGYVLDSSPFAQNWSMTNALSLVVQPAKYFFDFATFPFRAVFIQQPWTCEHTP